MYKKVTVGLMAIIMAGCATPNEMRTQTPILEAASNQPALDVATCIADKWENGKMLGLPAGFVIGMRPSRDGYEVSAAARNLLTTWTGLLAAVSNTTTGSQTRYFENTVFGVGEFSSAVTECQEIHPSTK